MKSFKEIREACWTGFKQVGFKMKSGKRVPNCVPESQDKENLQYLIKSLQKRVLTADPEKKADLLKRIQNLKKQMTEDAPANSAGSGNIAGIGVGPDGEPGVMPRAAQIYKKKNKEDLKGRMTKFLSKFRTVEQYNQQEVENIINKIESSQQVIENEIDPIVKFLKRKQGKQMYSEEEAIKSFRYIVDNHTSSLSEEVRNQAAIELIEKYL